MTSIDVESIFCLNELFWEPMVIKNISKSIEQAIPIFFESSHDCTVSVAVMTTWILEQFFFLKSIFLFCCKNVKRSIKILKNNFICNVFPFFRDTF